MHEYEVELQFSSTLLGHPDRTHDERGVVDGNEHSFGLANESLVDDKDSHDLFGSATPLPSSATMETSAVSSYTAFSVNHLVIKLPTACIMETLKCKNSYICLFQYNP